MDYTYKKRSNLYSQGSPPAYSNSRFESAPNIFAPTSRTKKLSLISGHRQYPQHTSSSPPVNSAPPSNQLHHSRAYQLYTPRPTPTQLQPNSNPSPTPLKDQDYHSHQSHTSQSPSPLLHRFSGASPPQASPDPTQMGTNEGCSIRSGGGGSCGEGGGRSCGGSIPKLNLYAVSGNDSSRGNLRPVAYYDRGHWGKQASSTGRLGDHLGLARKSETHTNNSTANLLRKSDYDSTRQTSQSPRYNPL